MPLRLNDVVFGHPGMVISVRTETGQCCTLREINKWRSGFRTRRPCSAAGHEEDRRAVLPLRLKPGDAQRTEGGPVKVMIALDITEDHNFVTEMQDISGLA